MYDGAVRIAFAKFLKLFDLLPSWLWAALCVGFVAHGCVATTQRDSARAQVKAIQADQALADNAALREREREITRLVGVTSNLQDAYREQTQALDTLAAASAADAGRLRQLATERRNAVAAAADLPALRGYAAVAGDVFEACRDEYRALGFDAERGAASTRALKSWADEVTRPAIDKYRLTLRNNPKETAP